MVKLKSAVISLIATAVLSGCAGRHSVVAVTGTTIGVEIAQNPQTQMYQAKLGYHRGEVAIVPSNRSADKDPGCTGDGAKDTTDVLMELKYKSMFSFSEAGIYQRLAVGPTAVSQPGAAFMFAKGDSGELSEAQTKAISAALNSINETDMVVLEDITPLAGAYTALRPSKQEVFDAAAKKAGYQTYRDFLLNPDSTKFATIRAELEKDAVIKQKLQDLAQ